MERYQLAGVLLLASSAFAILSLLAVLLIYGLNLGRRRSPEPLDETRIDPYPIDTWK